MIISKSSQLGLRFEDDPVKVLFLKLMLNQIENAKSTAVRDLEVLNSWIKEAKELPDTKESISEFIERKKEEGDNYVINYNVDEKKEFEIKTKITALVQKATNTELDFIQCIVQQNESSKYFFICDSVYYAAKLIKINEGFTSRTVKDIALGHYTYLMGKHRMLRFAVVIGAIKGFYYDDSDNVAFEWGLDIETGEYYAPKEQSQLFSMIMQVLTFIELGDIEVVELKPGKNNGKPKKSGKVANANKNTVFVVDSTWNQIIIRTDGFAVRGHFRLQPCGVGFIDRRLKWIDAFEKHGYTRRPRAEIAHNN